MNFFYWLLEKDTYEFLARIVISLKIGRIVESKVMITALRLSSFKNIWFFNLLFLFGNLYFIASENAYKKLINKRIAGEGNYHKDLNLFQCFNTCEKKNDCKIFNYNSELKICQLTDKKTDENAGNAINSYGWEVYFPTTKEKLFTQTEEIVKVMEFANQTSDRQITVDIENRTDLSTCFWFKQNDSRDYRTFFTLYADKPCAFISFHINNHSNRMRFFLWTYLYGRFEIINFDNVFGNATERFYHTCLVYSNKRFYFYIDGQRHDDADLSMQDNEISFKFMWIGKTFRYNQYCALYDGPVFVNGSLYDLSLFIRNLTQSEITHIMNGNSMVVPLLSWENVKARYINDNAVVLKQINFSQIKGEN